MLLRLRRSILATSFRIKCRCNNTYQDGKYGNGVRVACPVNKSYNMGKMVRVCCTVCGTEHTDFKEGK